MTKTIPKKRKCEKAAGLYEEEFQIAEERRQTKAKGERERYTQLNAEFHGRARRDKKAFLNEQCKEMRKTVEWKRLEISPRKLPSEYFKQGWA